ncbi:MAG: penicillin-binding protein 1B, partial [bacterium]
AIPARVYAQPLELYLGATVSAERLGSEFKRLGYRKVKHVSQPAQWSQQGGRFRVHTRDFDFWDGRQSGQLLEIFVDGSQVVDLADPDSGNIVDIARLEPQVVGSIYPAHNEDRVLVRYEDLPETLIQALLAVEDRKFFDHHGVDPVGIARALVANIQAGKTVQGGSTLTQQLVKNFFLTPDRSLWRKANEALMALILDSRYGKQEILEAYANEIYLGQDGARAIHGFGLAAWFYFNRPLTELDLAENALLVGLLKGASYYNPRQHPERARERRNLVLKEMSRSGFITDQQMQRASQRALGVTQKGKRSSASHPAFMDLVRRQLRRDYREEDLTSEGLRIFTTMDPWMQGIVEQTLASKLSDIEKRRKLGSKSLEGAVVLVSPQEGEVRALAGGRDGKFAGFNRALDAIRPIGSLVKPVVYLAALSQPAKYTLVSQLDDIAISLTLQDGQRWNPKNYDKTEHGLVPLHTALAKSMNLATVRLGMTIGLDVIAEQLQSLGVDRPIKPYPSLLLGATELSPLEVAQVYQALAAGGFRTPLRAIREISNAQGEPLQRYPLAVKRVADSGATYLLNRNLVEVVREGTGKSLSRYVDPAYEVAGKTGTTNDLRDSWFAGFTGDLVGVVWVGRDDNKPSGLYGSTGALPVWGEIMRRVGIAPLALIPPEEIDHRWVEPRSGFLSAEHCEGAVAFPFIKGSEPKTRASCSESNSLGSFLEGLFD